MLSSTRPPGGVIRHICRWVDVLSSRYATTGRSGSDLLRDDEGRAPQRRATGDSKEYYRSRTQRAEPRGPGRLTRYAIGTTARPHLGDSPLGPYWDGPPGKVCEHGFHPFSDLGRLASLDALRAGSGVITTYISTQRHHWSSTAVGYGPRSESGRHWADRADCEDRSGHSRFGSAAPGTDIGHCEL